MRDLRKRSEITENLLSIGLGDLFSQAISFVAFIYVVQVLGPSNLGLIGFGAAAAGLFLPFIDFGMGFIATREVSRNAASLGIYFKAVLFNRFILGCLSFVTLTLIGLLFFQNSEKSQVLQLYAFTFVPAMISLAWAYQGIGQMRWFFFEQNMQAMLYCAGVYVFVTQNINFIRIPLIQTVASVVPAMVILYYFIRMVRPLEGRLSYKFSFDLLRSSFRLFVPVFLSRVNFALALLLVAQLNSNEQAGFFSASSRIALVVVAFPNLMWSSFYRVMSRSSNSGLAIQDLGAMLYKYAVLVGSIPAFLGIVYARYAVNILFGSSYALAIVSFRLFSAVALLQSVSIIFTRILPALGMEKEFSKLVTVGVIVQLLGTALLAMQFGSSGAAASFVFAEVCIVVGALKLLRNKMAFNYWKYPALAIGLLGSCTILVELLRHFIPVPFVTTIAMVTILYGLILFASSIVSLKDFTQIEASLR